MVPHKQRGHSTSKTATTSKYKVRLPIRVKLWKNGELVASTSIRMKTSFFRFLQGNSWDRAYLKVTYPLGVDYYNDAEFDSLARAKRLLLAFTEWDLVRELL